MSIAELAALVRCVVGYEGRLTYAVSKPNGTPRKLLDVSRLHALDFRHRMDGVRSVFEDFKGEPHRDRRAGTGEDGGDVMLPKSWTGV